MTDLSFSSLFDGIFELFITLVWPSYSKLMYQKKIYTIGFMFKELIIPFD